MLEIAGCFILRKGTIESYYQASNQSITEGKPSAAVDEIVYLQEQSVANIETAFPEIARCLKFASLGERIDESESLRDILLAIVAPAVSKLANNATTQEVRTLSKSILGDRAKIFNLNINNDELSIGISSNILAVQGFPIVFKKGDNVIQIVEEALNIH